MMTTGFYDLSTDTADVSPSIELKLQCKYWGDGESTATQHYLKIIGHCKWIKPCTNYNTNEQKMCFNIPNFD